MIRMPPHTVRSAHAVDDSGDAPLPKTLECHVRMMTSSTLASAVSVAWRRPYRYAEPSVGSV